MAVKDIWDIFGWLLFVAIVAVILTKKNTASDITATGKAFTGALERLLTTVDTALGPSPAGDRESALLTASAAVGALVLARATHDEALAIIGEGPPS